MAGSPSSGTTGGSYVAHRLAMDYPDRATHLVVPDSVPIREGLGRADVRFAEAWRHWFFFAQPDKPERAITADPDAWYGADPEQQARMGEQNYADYLPAIHAPRGHPGHRRGLPGRARRQPRGRRRRPGRRTLGAVPHPGRLVDPRRHASTVRRRAGGLATVGVRISPATPWTAATTSPRTPPTTSPNY